MLDKNNKKYELSLNVASTLGGLTLAALTVLMSTDISAFSSEFLGIADYKHILIVGLGGIGSLFITSVFGLKGVVVNPEYENKPYAIITFGFYEAGFVGLLVLFPLLVMPFNFLAGSFIAFIELGWGILAIFNRHKYKPRLS